MLMYSLAGISLHLHAANHGGVGWNGLYCIALPPWGARHSCHVCGMPLGGMDWIAAHGHHAAKTPLVPGLPM